MIPLIHTFINTVVAVLVTTTPIQRKHDPDPEDKILAEYVILQHKDSCMIGKKLEFEYPRGKNIPDTLRIELTANVTKVTPRDN